MQKTFARIYVPRALQARLRDLVRDIGKKRTCSVLACSVFTLDDALCPGATLRPETLARIEAALQKVGGAHKP